MTGPPSKVMRGKMQNERDRVDILSRSRREKIVTRELPEKPAETSEIAKMPEWTPPASGRKQRASLRLFFHFGRASLESDADSVMG